MDTGSADRPVRSGLVGRVRRRPRVVLGVLGVPLVVLVLAQAFLPGLAADRVRSLVARYGHVESASVRAWPAVELLWGKAGSATVRASGLTLTPAQAASLLWEARGVHSVTVHARRATLQVAGLPGGLSVEDVTMHKYGSEVHASATLTQAKLDAALPGGFRVQPIASGPDGIEVQASGGLFGATASLRAIVTVSEGRVVAQPQGLPLASLATVSLFADPHLEIRSVALRVVRHQPLTYALALTARLR